MKAGYNKGQWDVIQCRPLWPLTCLIWSSFRSVAIQIICCEIKLQVIACLCKMQSSQISILMKLDGLNKDRLLLILWFCISVSVLHRYSPKKSHSGALKHKKVVCVYSAIKKKGGGIFSSADLFGAIFNSLCIFSLWKIQIATKTVLQKKTSTVQKKKGLQHANACLTLKIRMINVYREYSAFSCVPVF